MTVEELVSKRLKASTGVAALVGTRVYQLKLPQKPELPAIKVQLITDPKRKHLRGRVNGAIARIQVDAYSSESRPDAYAETAVVLDAVDDSLSNEPFTINGRKGFTTDGGIRRSFYEGGEFRLVRMSVDFDVFSKTV